MKICLRAVLVAASLLVVPLASLAETIALTAADNLGESSFNTGLHWSDATAPSPGNDYVVTGGGIRLRTPADGNSYTFGGDSLTIANSGTADSLYGLSYKGTGNTGTITIDNLILTTGGQINAINGSADVFNLDGAITISGDCSIYAKQGPINILAPVSGSATITNPGADNTASILTFMSSESTFTGSIVNNGRFTLATNAVFNFVIGANGVNNAVSGTGTAVFNGVFSLDLSSAGTTIGNSWQIASVTTKSFGENFSVAGFYDAGNGLWFQDNGSYYYQFDETTGTLSVVDPPGWSFGATLPAAGATGVTNFPELSCELIAINDTVNTGSIVMLFDDNAVPYSLSQSATTTTVSYAVTTRLEPLTVHTVQVIASGQITGPQTNVWSFTTAPEPIISYVDAVAGASGNTMSWDGGSWIEWNPPQDPGNIIDLNADNEWQEEWSGDTNNLFGNLPSTSNSWFEAGREAEGGENAPQLRTQVAGLDNGTYKAYAYFWSVTGDPAFRLGAALTNNPSGGLPIYGIGSNNVVRSDIDMFATEGVLVNSGNRSMYQVSLGSVEVTDGVLNVYIDDVGDATTVWFDGIGYSRMGITTDPDIQSFSVAGDTASLTWAAEGSGTYTILRKTDLTSGTWVPVKTGIPGAEPTKTDSVTISGADQEFYRVEGQ